MRAEIRVEHVRVVRPTVHGVRPPTPTVREVRHVRASPEGTGMTTAVVKLALADIRAADAALDDARTALADLPDDLTVAAGRIIPDTHIAVTTSDNEWTLNVRDDIAA